MGVDQLPENIKNSSVLTGNDLGMLGNTEVLPDNESIEVYIRMHKALKDILAVTDIEKRQKTLHEMAHTLLLNKDVQSAWKVLLSEQIDFS
jgi:hypothetical protein